MKKLILLISLLLFMKPLYAQEAIESFDDKNISILNDSIYNTDRKIRKLTAYTQDRILLWYIPNALATGTNKSGRLDIPFEGTIIKATAYCKTAPTGATLIFDINKNGTTIWSTQANRITISATENSASQTDFNVTAASEDDYFTIDIDQIGSGTAGADATVQLIIRSN